jgi:hypothetical protein
MRVFLYAINNKEINKSIEQKEIKAAKFGF